MKALILLIISGILAAGVFIAGKHAASTELSPLLILFWQMSGGALVVLIVSWPLRRFPVWNLEHVRYYLLGGLLGVSIPYVLAFMVLQTLQVGTVGLLTALSPVVTYAMARLLGVEQGHPLRLLGLITGLAGVMFLLTPGDSLELTDNWTYMLLALGIPVSLAASNIYRSRYWPAGADAIPLVTGMLAVQAVWLLIVNIALGNFNQLVTVNAQNNSWLLMAIALLAGTSYLSSFNLLRVGGPVYLSQMGYVITAVTMLYGIWFWNEAYDGHDLLSIGLIFSGVLMTTLTNMVRPEKQTLTVGVDR